MTSLFVALLLIAVPSAIWVYVDASRFDEKGLGGGPGGWALGVLLVWIVFFPLYLRRRSVLVWGPYDRRTDRRKG